MSKDSDGTTDKKQPTKDLADQLKKRLANALTPEDIRAVMKEIESSPLLPNDKKDLISKASAMLAKIEAEITTKSEGVNAITVNKEPLKTAKEEQQRHDLKVQPIYNDFDKIHTSFLTDQKAHNQLLEKALEDLKTNKTISDKTIAALTKTPEEIEKEKEMWAKIHLANKTAIAESEYHTNKLAEIDRALINNSQKSNLSRPELIEARKTHEELLAKAYTKIDETNKHYKEREKERVILKEGIEHLKKPGVNPEYAKLFQQNLLDTFNAMHNTPPTPLQEQKAEQLGVKSKETLNKSNDKNSINHPSAKNIEAAKDIREKIQQNLTCNNQPKDKKGQPQTTIPVVPRNKIIKDRGI